MYRPEGLSNPFKHSPFCGDPGASCRACGWEAGADAYGKALIEECSMRGECYMKDGKIEGIIVPQGIPVVSGGKQTMGDRHTGTFIFIPDEEEK